MALLRASWLLAVGALARAEDINLAQFRTTDVVESFDASKLSGKWYEVAYADPAQLGARCQQLENTVLGENIEQTFAVQYGSVPFAMNFTYRSTASRGLFVKEKDGFGGSLLQLPTVVVSVVTGANGEYRLMTELTSKSLPGFTVNELRFLSRSPSISAADLAMMTHEATQLRIIPQLIPRITEVSQQDCGAAQPVAVTDPIASILPPKFTTGKQVGIVFIIGAAIANTAYGPMLEAVQDAAAKRGISLFAAVPFYMGNTPQPVDLLQRIQDAQNRLFTAGLSHDAPQFVGAHSLGTVFLQELVNGMAQKPMGQVLMGGFLQRKFFSPFSYTVPTLTLAAELDGLARITRMTESYYHQKGQADFPVLVLPGQNHMQFASGAPPPNVQKNDLSPEVSEAVAHEQIGEATADWMVLRLQLGGETQEAAAAAQATRETQSQVLFDAIVKAYELEGSRRFNCPAQIDGPKEKDCVKGLCPSKSYWAPRAQEVISEPPLTAAGVKLQVTNSYVRLSGSPVTGQDFHLPNLTHGPGQDEVTISTWSECYFNDPLHEVFEDFDTGFTFTSAQEIGTKLWSRQCTENVGLGMDANFSVDDPNFCADTNQKALDWVTQNIPEENLQRFQQRGVPLVMGPDAQKEGGPWWIYARLAFNQQTGPDGKPIVEVVAPAAKTEQGYWKKHFHTPRPPGVPPTGCYHYCKLLSPARVMEWFLVDGLRHNASEELIMV